MDEILKQLQEEIYWEAIHLVLARGYTKLDEGWAREIDNEVQRIILGMIDAGKVHIK